ncbi:sigma 54-interacting transcriptional regulator, partial [Paenibacillus sp. TAF58]
EKTTFSIAETVQAVVLLFHQLFDNQRIVVQLEVPESCVLWADAQQIKQVLINLFKNAIDAMANGGQMQITAYSDGPHVIMTIEDTGEGIDPRDLANIYEPFFTRKAGGHEQYHLQSRVEWLDGEIRKAYDVHGLIGESDRMKHVFALIDKVKNIDSGILILGESGTGKELVARAIHFAGERREQVFSTINCAAIPANLMESELFGYEKGAFTGANVRKAGIFDTADGGTLFLDEIGELDIGLQSKLLRVLQEKAVTPIGGHKEKRIDVRIIAATNRDLKKEVQQGKFREDLYYRLNVIPIQVPPLRERKEDIPLLIRHFMDKIGGKMSKQIKGISQEALNLLNDYPFPGNVRELQNIIERSIALADGEHLTIRDMPMDLQPQRGQTADGRLVPIYVGDTALEAEKKLILATLRELVGNRRKTAEMLDIGERTLRDKMSKYKEEGSFP